MTEENQQFLKELQGSPKADPERVRAVRELFFELTKAAKIFRTYPRDNDMSIRAVDSLAEVLTNRLEKLGETELFVDRTQLTYFGETVYDDEDSRRSIAVRLDRDGVRRLLLSPGITRQEVVDLLTVMTVELEEDSLENDIVTLMWDKQFSHVKVFVLEEMDRVNETDEASTHVDVPCRDTVQQEQQEENLSPEETAQRDAENMAHLAAVCSQAKSHLVELPPERLELVRETAFAEASRDVTVDLEDILIEMIQGKTSEQAFSNCLKVLGQLVTTHLKRADFDGAADLLERMQELSGDKNLPDAEHQAIALMTKHILTAEHLRDIPDILGDLPEAGLKGLDRLLNWFPPDSMTDLVGLLKLNRHQDQVEKLLLQVLGKTPEVLVDQLAGNDLELAPRILNLLQTAAVEAMVPALARCLASVDGPMRTGVVKLIARFRTDRARAALMGTLNDPDPEVRRTAIKALAAFAGGSSRQIRDQIAAREFNERPMEEKKGLLAMVAQIDGDGAVPFLETFIANKKWFESRKQEESRACAVLALGQIESPRVHAVLERAATGKSESIRAAARLAMRQRPLAVTTG